MMGEPPYCITEETEDCSAQENQKTAYINNVQETKIIDVWADNFHEELDKISHLVKKYNFIAIDTQFPSIIDQAQSQFNNYYSDQYTKYQKLAKNVNETSLIQLGMCIADQEGNVPIENFCWQFNFKFQENISQISPTSEHLLENAGINFQKLKTNGISYKTFTHQFIKSGFLLNKQIKWIVFHGCFDFSYLLKLIRNQPMPKIIQDFHKSIKIYFPEKIDLKCLIQKDKFFKKYGLSKLAETIKCRRIGPQHQAGSDSMLTLQAYFKIKYNYENLFSFSKQVQNQIYGIGYITNEKNKTFYNKHTQLTNLTALNYSSNYENYYYEYDPSASFQTQKSWIQYCSLNGYNYPTFMNQNQKQ